MFDPYKSTLEVTIQVLVQIILLLKMLKIYLVNLTYFHRDIAIFYLGLVEPMENYYKQILDLPFNG